MPSARLFRRQTAYVENVSSSLMVLKNHSIIGAHRSLLLYLIMKNTTSRLFSGAFVLLPILLLLCGWEYLNTLVSLKYEVNFDKDACVSCVGGRNLCHWTWFWLSAGGVMFVLLVVLLILRYKPGNNT